MNDWQSCQDSAPPTRADAERCCGAYFLWLPGTPVTTRDDGRPGVARTHAQLATHVRMVASMVPLTWDEISQHNTKNDCWVVVDGVVYDMTDFLDDHPGGKRLPVKHSGKDVTEIWNSFHGEAACSAAKPS